jgi:hypothetical protein
VTSLVAEFDNNITENFTLPKSSILVIIRFKHQGYKDLQEVEEANYMDHIKEIMLTRSGHRSCHHQARLDRQNETTISPDSRQLLGMTILLQRG